MKVKNRNNRMNVKKMRLGVLFGEDEVREFAARHSVAETAEHFGVTFSAAYYYLHARGIPYVRYKRTGREYNGERDQMIAYLAQKYTDASIGRTFGISRERVRQICEREAKEYAKKQDSD